jgi:hypothetical protein
VEGRIQAGDNPAQRFKFKISDRSEQASAGVSGVVHRCSLSPQVGILQPSGEWFD